MEGALDGDRAVEILEDVPNLDLVILDLAMLRRDGWATLKSIRGNVGTGSLPVLDRTGTGSDEIDAQLLKAGADDHVSRSTDAMRFLARVGAVTRRTRV